jgi:serine/threonine protein kinase
MFFFYIHGEKVLSPHPNIVRYECALHGLHNVYIITEGFQGDLFDFLADNAMKINANIAAVITRDILTALAHLAQHQIVHRDLKSENVLIQLRSNNLIVKLCDFGLSRHVESHEMLNDFCGSPGFYAPECVQKRPYDGYYADVFSCGCITLEMLVPQGFFSNIWLAAYSKHKEHKELIPFSNASEGSSKSAIPTAAQSILRSHTQQKSHNQKTVKTQPKLPNDNQEKSTEDMNLPLFLDAIRDAILASHMEIVLRYPHVMPLHEFITRVLHVQPTLRPKVRIMEGIHAFCIYCHCDNISVTKY